jgi:hypothetical protein
MEHKHLDQLRSVADVEPGSLTREERLQRWIELLERNPSRRLNTLGEIEYQPPAERALVRVNDSPLTVAYEDPVLQAEGLASDRLGDAMAFFGMTDGQAHYALCSCLSGHSMEAGTCAQRLRNTIGAQSWHPVAAAWGFAALALGLPGFFYLLS